MMPLMDLPPSDQFDLLSEQDIRDYLAVQVETLVQEFRDHVSRLRAGQRRVRAEQAFDALVPTLEAELANTDTRTLAARVRTAVDAAKAIEAN